MRATQELHSLRCRHQAAKAQLVEAEVRPAAAAAAAAAADAAPAAANLTA